MAQAALVIARVAPGEPVVRAGLVELAAQVVRVAPAELGIVQVEVPLAIVQGVALELAIGHPLVHLAVLLRIRSGIAAHHRGLVPRLVAVEDLAAAAETTREPAAVEAVIAWAAVA